MQYNDNKPMSADACRSFYGRIEPYVPGECFQSYRELAEEFFRIYNIEEENMQRFILIKSMGSGVHKKLRTLVHPVKPTECDIEIIWEVLEKYYSPQSHSDTLALRHKFFNSSQESDESTADYAIRIKNLAVPCKFGNFIPNNLLITTSTTTELRTLALEDALLSKFITGLLDSDIQQSLLTKKNLTFKTCVDLATNIEMSKSGEECLSPPTYTNANHTYTQRVNRSPCRNSSQTYNSQKSVRFADHEGNCKACGCQDASHTCPANKSQCYSCGGIGHTSEVCTHIYTNPMRGTSKRNTRSQSQGRNSRQRNLLRETLHSQPSVSSSDQVNNCKRCGCQDPTHTINTCPAITWQCFTCGGIGHTSVVCTETYKNTIRYTQRK